ncbi:MAG: TonB-dependent receptor [Chitinophagales bacterium]
MSAKLFFTLSLLLFSFNIEAQNVNISGTITDAESGETITGAIVSVPDLPGIGTATNAYGFYSLSLPAGSYKVRIKFLGYEEKYEDITISTNTKKNFSIRKKAKAIKEVTVSGKKKQKITEEVQMGKIQVDLKELEKIPVILGERDVLKSIQLLPGVMPQQEGASGIIVRGGGVDQNLILLDEAPVYNASHLLGFFSTFNSDALKDLTLYKGNMPAEYGGRLSSVIDVKMKEGNNKNYEIGGGIGLIASRLYAEGPIQKDKSSFFVSGRRTYADAFLFLASDSVAKKSTLYFYDLNLKTNFKISEKDRIYFSGYFGNDHFGLADAFGIQYGNVTATTRWNRIISDKLFSNTSFIYNNFNYQVKIGLNNFDLKVNSILNNYSLKQDYDYFLNGKNRIKVGGISTWYNVVPGDIESSDTLIAKRGLNRSNGWENAVYIQNEQTISPKLKINYGLRLSLFTVAGSNNLYSFDESGKVLDTTILKNRQLDRSYFNPEPRFSVNYSIKEGQAIKLAYSRNVQYRHQLSNTNAGSPTDRWVLSTRNIRPAISDQISAGYFFNFADDMFEASIEGYFKYMQNQIDYKPGTVLRANETVEKDLVNGVGRAYGAEFFLKKRVGKLTGWISYTLARSDRSFDGIDGGEWFPYRYDRTHDISIVAMYDLSQKINLSGTFVYYTGNATNYPTGKYAISGDITANPADPGLVYTSYERRNKDRFPSYTRVDLALNWMLKKGKTWEHELSFSIYNVLGAKNAFQIDFLYDNPSATTYAEKTYLFAQVPSITYNFKFKPKKAVSKENK